MALPRSVFVAGGLLIALAQNHEQYLLEQGATPERVALLTAFDPEHPEDPDVFDPYHSDDAEFTRVLQQVERSCAALIEELRSRLG